MSTLLNAAKYLVQNRDFTLIYNGEPMFDDPIVPASQRDTFDALHILASVATDSDIRLINVKRVMNWLGEKTKAANAR